MAAVITRIGSKKKPKISEVVSTAKIASNVRIKIPISHILKIFCMRKKRNKNLFVKLFYRVLFMK